METQSEVEEHLKQNAFQYANLKEFRFGSGASSDIDRMTKRAAHNIFNPPPRYREDPINDLIKISEGAIAKFIEKMIEAREEVYEDTVESNIIGEQTFDWAKKRICPMWPIC